MRLKAIAALIAVALTAWVAVAQGASGFPDFEAWWYSNKPSAPWATKFTNWYEANKPMEEPPPPPPPPDPGTLPTYRLTESFDAASVPAAWQFSAPFTADPVVTDGVVRITTPIAQPAGSFASFSRWVWEPANMPPEGEGATVEFGGDLLVPNPGAVAWSRFIDLAHYEGDPTKDWLIGLHAREPGNWWIGSQQLGGSGPWLPLVPVTIPANQRIRIDVRATLSRTAGAALTEVWIDGALVGTSTAANMVHPTAINLYQGGVAYWYPPIGQQTIQFDNARTG
jgi:hypothetical protein